VAGWRGGCKSKDETLATCAHDSSADLCCGAGDDMRSSWQGYVRRTACEPRGQVLAAIICNDVNIEKKSKK